MKRHWVEDFIEFCSQTFPFLSAQGQVLGSHQVVVEGGVGVPRGADCHSGEAEVLDVLDLDGGHHRGVLEIDVGFVDQD